MRKPHKPHWLDHAYDILASGSNDLRRLAEIAGVDAAAFYRHQSLASCDLRGQDLRGMDLTGCEIDKAVIDESTKMDARFDPRLLNREQYIVFKVTRLLNKLILEFSADAGYVYGAWAYKSLIDRGLRIKRINWWQYYQNIIKINPYLNELVSYKSKSSLVEKTVQVYGWQQSYIEDNFDDLTLDEALSWIMLVGALAKRIRHNSRKDYSTLPPNALFPARRSHAKFQAFHEFDK